MAIKLYDSPQSVDARKIRLLAAELGIPLQCVSVSLMKGENLSPDYLAQNPAGRIPAVDDDGFVLTESASILKYLAAKRIEKGLIPTDPKEYARLDQWMFWWAAHPEQALFRLAHERVVKPLLGQPGHDPSIVGEAEADLDQLLPVLERQLERGEYILGKLSVVDFQVGPWVEVAPRMSLDLGRYRSITSWLERMQARAYWKDG